MNNSLTLNGKTYTKDELLKRWYSQKFTTQFEYQVYEFIAEWLNDSDFFRVPTSGSTGKAKIISISKQKAICSAQNTIKFFNICSNHNLLLCLPVKYIAGKMMIIRAFVSQCNLLIEEPSANPFLNCKESIYFVALTPYQLSHSFETLKNKNIKHIIIGGATIPTTLEKKLNDICSNVYATYGMTETCSHVALRKANGNDCSDIFTALPKIYFSVNKNQCLVIKAPELTQKTMVTNDIVELLNNKQFRWIGRYDNIINSGGIKLHPEIIEQKLTKFIPDPFFISSVPDEHLSEAVALFIENENYFAAQIDSLRKAMQFSLEPYEIPKHIILMKKFLYTENGKILRKETKKLYYRLNPT